MLSGAPSVRLNTGSERPSSPQHLEPAMAEMFVSEENINQMENILDTCSNKLKVSLLPHSVKL